MDRKIKFLMVSIILSLFMIAAVSAEDNNTEILGNGTLDDVKDTPDISINTSSIYTGKSIGISLKDSNNTKLTNQTLKATIGGGKYSLITDDNGQASLKLNLKPNSYILNVVFEGNDNFTSVNKNFNVKILKLGVTVTPVSTSVLKNKYFNVYLKDNFGNPIKSSTVTFTINKVKYTAKTNDNGKASLKITLNPNAKYSVKISYAGTKYYNSVSKTISLIVPATTSLVVGNDKLLSNGYLRIYLKSSTLSAISKKTIKITIGSNSYTKTTNSEGIVIFKPGLGVGNFEVNVTFDGSSTIIGCNVSKNVVGINGNVKDPTKQKIPLKNGVPDVDWMPGNYVMADGNMKYTLLKSQYKDVIQRDSYTLYLYNKLSKYVFFKTKSESKLNHILVREKWNVIERAVYTNVVLKNKNGYWPNKIAVALSGKSYSYGQVRDTQNTRYSCGPTSCSMCTQFLKNYVCEKQLVKLSKCNPYSGSSTSNLKKALEKCNFKCSIYYKSSFNNALKELKKGGCALVFHTWNHYVSILDISKDGKKVLMGNPSGHYDYGSHGIPTKWVSVKFIKGKFNNYDTSGLIVKLKYSLSKSKKTQLKNTYSSMGAGWVAKNTKERIPNIGL